MLIKYINYQAKSSQFEKFEPNLAIFHCVSAPWDAVS